MFYNDKSYVGIILYTNLEKYMQQLTKCYQGKTLISMIEIISIFAFYIFFSFILNMLIETFERDRL